ncbi:ABC transporter substrate-binding protein [Paenibacillus pinihumi]|uniref:ABC transporter substrate-binding protein n=1 Tax=Paenibacillus pinihumi TaxID=669462 RepID=UPI0003FB38A6|nr:ABC transporter substrate-binding protein [Paenibacillus pinihumi]
MARLGQMIAGAMVLLILMTGLAACGSAGNTQEEAPVQTNIEQAQQSGIADGTEAAKDEEHPATRTVTDEFGEVVIPAHPKRVAAIYLEDYLKALDVTPVVQWYHPSWGTQEYLNLDLPLFDISGNLEVLLQHDPDLILVDGAVDKAKYELYSKIAPTYRLKEDILQDSKQILTTIADVLNIPDKAAIILQTYENKVAEAKEKLQQAAGKETVAVVRVNVADKTLALFGIKNRYTGVIYKEFGLEPHKMAKEMTDYHAILSEESIPELDADHLIVFPSNGDWDTAENKEALRLLNSPLWNSVPAVKKGNVYKFNRSHWQSGQIIANSMKLDDLLNAMVK